MHQSEKKIPLKIAGGQGWGNISIDSLICRLGLQDSVTLLGKVSDKKLMALYEAAYALLMPSLYEGFGMPVLEAMSYGVPVIISQKSSMEEVAENAALLIDPLDTDSMATAMYRLETDNVLHKSLSAAAKKRATLYSWDESSNQLLSLLEDVFQNYGKINP